MSFAPRARALLALFALCATASFAQHPLMLVFPQNGSTDITTRPEIVVLSPAPIDLGSITTRWPNSEANGWRSDEPTLLILREQDARSVPRDGWTRYAVRVRYTQIDPRLLRMTVGPLQPGTRYVCALQRISVDGGAVLPPLEFGFTTRHDIPRLLDHTLVGRSAMRCSDTVRLAFSSPLSTLPLPIGSYVQVMAGGQRLPIQPVIDATGRGVTLAPAGRWPVGEIVQFDVRMSHITGDASDDQRIAVHVRSATTVRVEAAAVDGREVPSSVASLVRQNSVVGVNDGVYELRCPTWLDEQWRFVRWECAALPLIDGSTSNTARITLTCEKLDAELNVSAVIEAVDTVKVPVDVDDGAIDVYDDVGTLIRVIDDADTLILTPARPRLLLHAVAAAGMGFTAWTANGTPINGSTGAALGIGMQGMHPGIPGGTVGPRVTPRFIPQLPTAEKFRLRGELRDMDPDDAFDVEAGVVWTTVRRYEEMQSVTRPLCIQATDCWEILGHVTIYGVTMYPQAQREACVDELLLDPENVVTFLVRRIPLHLRVEMALLDSDDADDVILDKHPHADVRVSAELRKRKGASSTWMPLGDVACRTPADLARMSWKISCGDEIRVRVRDAASRGEHWKFFAPVNNYVLPAGGEWDRDSWTYTIVAGTDIANFDAVDCHDARMGRREIRARACFRADLGIEAIGVRMRILHGDDRAEARFEQRWLDPLVYMDEFVEEPIGGRQLEYVPRQGTPIKIKFTRPIDITTIEGGAMSLESWGNIDPLDPARTGTDFTVRSSGHGHIGYEPINGEPITTVIFNAYDPRTAPIAQATHLGTVLLRCATDIRSLRGIALRAPASFLLQSIEAPGYGLFLRSVSLRDDGDWDFWPFVNNGEIYHALYGGLLGLDAARHTESGFRRLPDCAIQQGTVPDECTYEQSDEDPPMQFGDLMQYMESQWLDLRDQAFSYIITHDEDCKDEDDCLVNRIGGIIEDLKDQIKNSKGSKKDEIDWGDVIPGIIRGGLTLMGQLLSPDQQDDYLGEHTMVEGRPTLWGVTNQGGIITRNGQNASYEFKARFYPRAAIVR